MISVAKLCGFCKTTKKNASHVVPTHKTFCKNKAFGTFVKCVWDVMGRSIAARETILAECLDERKERLTFAEGRTKEMG